MVDGPVQHFRVAVLDAWRDLNSADLCRQKGVRGGPLLDFRVYYAAPFLFSCER